MKSFFITAILFCIAFFYKHTNAQTYNPNPQIWVIDAETSMCENSNNECLLIKQNGKKEFEIFNESIEGFNYEKGNIYTISVRQEIKQPPIAVGESVFKFVLIKIISKKPVNNITTTASNSTVSNSTQKIFEVNFETVPCESDNSKTCLLVKEKGKKEYEILNATIYGFNYQPGYSYVIAVKETSNGNYYLVNEISKNLIKNTSDAFNPMESIKEGTATKTPSGKIIQPTSIQTSSSLDGKWYLRKMKESDSSSFVTDDNIMWIEIKTFNDQINGFGACNKFAAVVKSDLNTTFSIYKITSGYSSCGNKKLEDLFYDLLEQANRFEIKNGNLIISNQWNFLMGFTSNPDNKEDITTTYTPPSIVKNEEKIYASSQPTTIKVEEKYVPPLKTSTTNETVTSSQNNTSSKTPVNIQETTNTDDALDKEIEELRKQLEEKKMKAELAAQIAKQAEIDELKKQAEEKKIQDELAAKQAEIEKLKFFKEKEIDDIKKQELATAQAAEQAKAAEAAKAKADKVAKLKAEQERLQKEMDELYNGTAITTTSKSSIPVESTTTKPIINSTKSVVTEKPIDTTKSVIKQETKSTNNLVFQEPKTIGVYAQEKEIAIGLITDNQTNLSKSFAFVELFNNNPIQLDNKILSAKIVDFVYTSYYGIEGVIYENNVNLKFYKEGKKIKDIKCNNDWESIFNAILVEIQKFGDYKYNGKFQVVKEGKHANFYNRKIVNNLPGKLRIEVPETKIINLKSINANIEKYTSKNPTQEVKELIGNYSESDLNEIFEYRSAFVLPSYKSTLKPLLYPISKTMAFSLKMLSYGGVFVEKKENNLALNCFYTALNAIKETISSSKEKAIINCIAFKNISDIYNVTENRKEMTKLLALASDINNDFSNSDVAKKEFDEYYLATEKVLALAVAQYRSTGSPGLSILSAVTGSLAASSGSFSNLGVDLSSLTSSLSSINSQLQTMQQSNTSSSNEISPIDNKLIAESFIVDGVDIKNSNNYVSSEVLYYLMTNPLIIKTTLLEYSNDKPKLNKLLLDFYNSKETNKATLIQDVYTQLNKIETVIIGLEARNKVVEEKYKLNF